DPNLRRQGARDLPSVAAPDIQPVVVEERVEGGDGLAEALVPLLLAGLLEGGVAELLLVGPGVPTRVMGELNVRHEPSVDEERGSESRPEGHDQLHAPSAHGAEARDVGVVGGANGPAESLGQGAVDVDADPG